jgi:methyl coenzyme M reductase gamma subunit
MKNPIKQIEGSLSKTNIEELAKKITEGIAEGTDDPGEMIIKIEFLKKALEAARKIILEDVIDEAERHGREGISIAGVKVRKKESGVKYDYSKTESWNEIQGKINTSIHERKILETQLKAIETKKDFIDPETGEVLEYFPAIKTSTTTVEVVFPKN